METVPVLTRCIVLETTEETLRRDVEGGFIDKKLFGIQLVDTKENLRYCLAALLPEPK